MNLLLKNPSWIDFRSWAGDREDQGESGSCTAQDLVNAVELMASRVGETIHLSALFNYYESRNLIGIHGDNGSSTDAALKSAMVGVASESLYPFDQTKVDIKPTESAYNDAHNFKILSYERLTLDKEYSWTREATIKNALLNYPVLFETNVTYKFSAEYRPLSGQIYNNPNIVNQYIPYGRHSMALEAYGLQGTYGYLVAENSWGKSWGDNGFGLVGSSYASDSAYIITGFEVRGKQYDFTVTENKLDVSQLYASIFGRAADAGGMTYWSDQLSHGASTANVANTMLSCASSNTLYANGMQNSEYIDTIYHNVLGRAADKEGHDYWVSQLNKGVDKGKITCDIIYIIENYNGNDASSIASKSLFLNRAEVGIYNSIFCSNNNIEIAKHALDNVTSNVDSVPEAQTWIAGQLLEHGWF